MSFLFQPLNQKKKSKTIFLFKQKKSARLIKPLLVVAQAISQNPPGPPILILKCLPWSNGQGKSCFFNTPACLHWLWSSHWEVIIENIYWVILPQSKYCFKHFASFNSQNTHHNYNYFHFTIKKTKSLISHTTRIWTQRAQTGNPHF